MVDRRGLVFKRKGTQENLKEVDYTEDDDLKTNESLDILD